LRPLLAFHGDRSVKDKYLARVEAHRRADEIIQGQYWEQSKGGAVGCTIHGDDHQRYEVELGIPAQIALLEDHIFEALPNAAAKDFPASFLAAIPVGADLAMVVPKFIHWLLTSPEIDLASKADAAGKTSIGQVAGLYERWIGGEKPLESEWDAAWETARAARTVTRAATRAVRAAARAARTAGTAGGAWEAAWEAGEAAWEAGESGAWDVMAAKLIALLSDV